MPRAKRFVSEMEAEYGRCDVLVNNAGIAFKNSDPTPFRCVELRVMTGAWRARRHWKYTYYGAVVYLNAFRFGPCVSCMILCAVRGVRCESLRRDPINFREIVRWERIRCG